MADRPPWTPADVADEDVPAYLGTLDELRDRTRWFAGSAPHLLARMDQLDAQNAAERDRVLREHFSDE